MDIKVKVAKISTDMKWLKKIITIVIIALAALFGVSLPPGTIE